MTKGLTLSDGQVFEMIQQTADDAKVARRRTYKISKKQDVMASQLDEMKECYNDHESRISKIENFKDRICDDGKHCGEDEVKFTKPEISRMKQIIKWTIIAGSALVGIMAAYLSGNWLGVP